MAINLYSEFQEALSEENLNIGYPANKKPKRVERDRRPVDEYVHGKVPKDVVVMRLRFDAEGKDAREAALHMYSDALDLLVNGDVIGNQNDALLKSYDGMMKRGKVPKDVALIQSIAVKEKENEYTLWALIRVDWGGK